MSKSERDLMIEVMASFRAELDHLRGEVSELKSGFSALRGYAISMQTEIQTLYAINQKQRDHLADLESRLSQDDPAA